MSFFLLSEKNCSTYCSEIRHYHDCLIWFTSGCFLLPNRVLTDRLSYTCIISSMFIVSRWLASLYMYVCAISYKSKYINNSQTLSHTEQIKERGQKHSSVKWATTYNKKWYRYIIFQQNISCRYKCNLKVEKKDTHLNIT